MNSQPTIASKRCETRAQYDRHPFGFDQPEILAEKLEKRMMGESIRARRGGTLIVSVYNRKSWYYYAYRRVGGLVRGLRLLIGDRGLKLTIFPFFHLGTVRFRRPEPS